jgi:hypothetical protein
MLRTQVPLVKIIYDKLPPSCCCVSSLKSGNSFHYGCLWRYFTIYCTKVENCVPGIPLRLSQYGFGTYIWGIHYNYFGIKLIVILSGLNVIIICSAHIGSHLMY